MGFRSYFSFKAIRFVVITILLGAFGSGAWEWLLKPFVMGASEFGLNKLGRPILVIFIFLLVFSVVQANQHAYVNRAITNFEQLLAVVGPHISEQDRMLYRSRFAQIASSEEYAKLTSELRERCRVKNLRTPEFSVW